MDYARLHQDLPSVLAEAARDGDQEAGRYIANIPQANRGGDAAAGLLSGDRARVEVCARFTPLRLSRKPLAEIPQQVRRTQAVEEMSVVVLDGFRLRSDAKLTVAPGTRMRRARRCGSWSER